MPTALITGANRGIGLAFVRSLAGDGWRVHACCRHPEKAKDVKAVEGDVVCHRLDVTDGLQVAGLARELAEEPIDLLVNNAGLGGAKAEFGKTPYEAWEEVLRVNTIAPLRVAEHFTEHVAASDRKVIANISSQMGSIAGNSGGGSYAYRSSKAALNMVTRGLAADLAERGVTVVALSPGWVRTDMGDESAPLSAEQSVAHLRANIARLGLEDSGKFLGHDGSEVPW